jgi:hypothetical protein
MTRWIKDLVGGGADDDDELLSPNCELLARAYDFEAGAVLSVGVDPAKGIVVVEMDLPLAEGHPAHSALREVRRLVTATFHGVVDPSATVRGEPLARGGKVDFETEHEIDELYISATAPWAYRSTTHHTHVFWCIAEGLVLAFPFADVRCKELLEE